LNTKQGGIIFFKVDDEPSKEGEEEDSSAIKICHLPARRQKD
jgi:hypothetical protein